MRMSRFAVSKSAFFCSGEDAPITIFKGLKQYIWQDHQFRRATKDFECFCKPVKGMTNSQDPVFCLGILNPFVPWEFRTTLHLLKPYNCNAAIQLPIQIQGSWCKDKDKQRPNSSTELAISIYMELDYKILACTCHSLSCTSLNEKFAKVLLLYNLPKLQRSKIISHYLSDLPSCIWASISCLSWPCLRYSRIMSHPPNNSPPA